MNSADPRQKGDTGWKHRLETLEETGGGPLSLRRQSRPTSLERLFPRGTGLVVPGPRGTSLENVASQGRIHSMEWPSGSPHDQISGCGRMNCFRFLGAWWSLERWGSSCVQFWGLLLLPGNSKSVRRASPIRPAPWALGKAFQQRIFPCMLHCETCSEKGQP